MRGKAAVFDSADLNSLHGYAELLKVFGSERLL